MTEFMNKGTYSQEEINQYPYEYRHTYLANWCKHDENNQMIQPVEFYAVDDETALDYLKGHFTQMPDILSEKTITFRDIKL